MQLATTIGLTLTLEPGEGAEIIVVPDIGVKIYFRDLKPFEQHLYEKKGEQYVQLFSSKLYCNKLKFDRQAV